MKILISYAADEALQAAGLVQQLRESLPPTRIKSTPGEKFSHYYIKTKPKKTVDGSKK